MIDAVAVTDQSIGHAAQIEQAIPIAMVARYPKFVAAWPVGTIFQCSVSASVFACNDRFLENRCSADLPSCRLPGFVTILPQNVFASASAEQRRQGAHLLVTGGNGAHAGWPTPTAAVLSGRAE